MTTAYDAHYRTRDLFGSPYPELIKFFSEHPRRGKVLDMGCGQGRNAIALARLGYSVTGIDVSSVGVDQMIAIARAEELDLIGLVEDIYSFDRYHEFEFVLLDSMLHFYRKDREKEIGLVKTVLSRAKPGCILVFCLPDNAAKIRFLQQALDADGKQIMVADRRFAYSFEDQQSGQVSDTDYRMLIVRRG